jgi:hypothetical protein
MALKPRATMSCVRAGVMAQAADHHADRTEIGEATE